MAGLEVHNWFGDLTSHPKVLVDAPGPDELVAILKDRDKYPPPVRAVGSNHSTARCSVADGGTHLKVGRFFAQYGVEAIDAPSNALFSHAYAFLDNPFTQTGFVTTVCTGSDSGIGSKRLSTGPVSGYLLHDEVVLLPREVNEPNGRRSESPRGAAAERQVGDGTNRTQEAVQPTGK